MLSRNRPLLAEACLWAINITAVFFATYYLFEMNNRAVFFGYDSQSFRSLFSVSYGLSEVLFGLGSDFVNGFGNVSADPNPRWFPSVLLAWLYSDLKDGPFAFAIGATELFAATLLCGRSLSLSLTVSIAGGWLITLWTWPVFVMPKIVTLWMFTPTHAEVLSVSVIITTAAFCIGARPIWRSILLAALAFLGITHIVLGNPTNLALVGPVIAISAGISVLLSSNNVERLIILLCWAAVAVACFVLGYFHYIWGLLAYTATSFFPEVWSRPHTLFHGETTLLLWTPVTQFTALFLFSPERLFVGGGIVGAVALLLLGSSRQRRLALSVLVAETVILSFGFTNYFWPLWSGPQMGYYEMMLFPYFALCICFLAFLPASLLWRIARNCFPVFQIVPRIADGAVALALPVSIGFYSATIGPDVRKESQRYAGFAIASAFPQPETPITRILKAEVRLIPGEPFRGRVASIWGRSPAVLNRGAAGQVHYFSQLATGNLHDGPGLWQDYIPTWVEYNRLMTPARFVFQSADLRMMRAAGVRFVITDAPLPEAKLRSELTIPTPPSSQQQLLFSSEPAFESFQLYLYELKNPNLGQYNPIEVKQTEPALSVRQALVNTVWDLDHTVFGVIPGTGPFEKADLESFTIERDGYKVRAKSKGSAILLLPIEFSRCLTVSGRVDAPQPRLFRADLVLTGVLFEQRLDADISFRVGPGEASRCRLQDASDAERMQIRQWGSVLKGYWP